MNLQNIEVTRQMAREREASLRPLATRVRASRMPHVGRWLARQLIRAGTWLDSERPMTAADAR